MRFGCQCTRFIGTPHPALYSENAHGITFHSTVLEVSAILTLASWKEWKGLPSRRMRTHEKSFGETNATTSPSDASRSFFCNKVPEVLCNRLGETMREVAHLL